MTGWDHLPLDGDEDSDDDEAALNRVGCLIAAVCAVAVLAAIGCGTWAVWVWWR